MKINHEILWIPFSSVVRFPWEVTDEANPVTNTSLLDVNGIVVDTTVAIFLRN